MSPGGPLGETAFRIFCSIFSIRTPRLACYLDEPMLIFAEAMRVSEADTKLPLRLATAVPIFLSNSNYRGETVPPWPLALKAFVYTSVLL